MALRTVRRVDEAVAALALEGSSVRLAEFGAVTTTTHGLSGTATTSSCLRRANCDSILLRRFVCGDERGLLLAVMTGNYKDDATAVASSVGAVALASQFDEPLLSQADIAPALRRAAIGAHDDILELSEAPLDGYEFATVMAKRNSMRGIGASLIAVAVLPRQLYGIHAGDGQAFLLRNHVASKLALEHTLNHTRQFREAARAEQDVVSCPELVLVNVLGMSRHVPNVDVFKVELRRGDKVLVGGLTLNHAIASDVATEHSLLAPATYRSRSAGAPLVITESLIDAMSLQFPGAPTSVGLIGVW